MWKTNKREKEMIFYKTVCMKNAQEYIEPSGDFVLYEILCSSNVFGRTSPTWCYRGSPGGWNNFFTELIDTYHGKIHWKNCDNRFINGENI